MGDLPRHGRLLAPARADVTDRPKSEPGPIIYTVPGLEAAMDEFARRCGVRPALGGRHPEFGTRNALVGLSGGVFMELMGPDPRSAPAARGRPLGLDGLTGPRLAGWSMRVEDIERAAARASERGFDPGPVVAMSRIAPDGRELRWRLTLPRATVFPLVVPPLIDWGDTRHPSLDAPVGLRLERLTAAHPDVRSTRASLAALECDLDVAEGLEPALVATIATPLGQVTL